MAARPEFLTVGRVLRAHGVHGGVIVVPLTDQRRRFDTGSRLLAGDDRRPLTIASAVPYKGRLLVRFEQVSDRETAEGLRRADLAIPSAEAGEPPEGEVWAYQLEGLRVEDATGRLLGAVVVVEDYPAHDVLMCADPDGREFAIPLVDEFVDDLAPESGRVVVRPIPGMLPGDE